MAAAYALDTI